MPHGLGIFLLCNPNAFGNPSSSQLLEGSTFSERVFWEKKLELGDQERFAIRLNPVIKNTGQHKNRRSLARFTADGWIFDRKLPLGGSSQDGQLLDIHAGINRGQLSSYSYVRILGETKWEAPFIMDHK